nr:ThaI family type II restriction endonuclease [Candidatus Njordarchaeum guaymaensis]
MPSRLIEIFKDNELMNKIGKRLPYLFQIAELESSRAGKVGMEVGSLREKILIALLIYTFGEENVETQIPITEPEVDVKLFGHPVSIKTITGIGGVKFSWTVDAQKAQEFVEAYSPKTDILLAQIKWNGTGNLFYVPLEVQQRIFRSMGRETYFKLPKPGTNPRGVEVSKEALLRLMRDEDTNSLKIVWQRSEIEYNPYQRWVDYWEEK